MASSLSDTKARAEAILAEAEARRTRMQAPAWTLGMYNWWRAHASSTLPRQSENLCHFFWTPVRAAGLWVELQLKRLPGGDLAWSLYMTFLCIGLFSAISQSLVSGVLIGSPVAYIVIGVLRTTVGELRYGRDPLHTTDDRLASRIFRPVAFAVVGVRRLPRSAAMQWAKRHARRIVQILLAACLAVVVWFLLQQPAPVIIVVAVLVGAAAVIVVLVQVIARLIRGPAERWEQKYQQRRDAKQNAWYAARLQAIYSKTLPQIYHQQQEAGYTDDLSYDQWVAQGTRKLRSETDYRLSNGLYSNMRYVSSICDTFVVHDIQLWLRALDWAREDLATYQALQQQQYDAFWLVRLIHTMRNALWLIGAFVAAKKKRVCPLIDVGPEPTREGH